MSDVLETETVEIPKVKSQEVLGAGRLSFVSNGAIRARRHFRAIVWMWLFQAAFALAVAWPAARAVGVSFGNRADGDAALFADGAYALSEWLTNQTAARVAISTTLGIVTAATFVLGILPLTALLVSLASTTRELKAPRLIDVMPVVARSAWPMLVLLALGTLAEGLTIVVGALFSNWIDTPLATRFGDARGGQIALGFLAAFVLVALAIGVVHDLARAAVVRFRLGPIDALRFGVTAFRKSKLELFWSWAWRALVGLLLLVGIYAVTTRLGGRPGAALAALVVFHQLVIGVRIALRASWLAKALRAVDLEHA